MRRLEKLLLHIGFENILHNNEHIIFIYKKYDLDIYLDENQFLWWGESVMWENLGDVNDTILFIKNKFFRELRKYKIDLLYKTQ